MPIQITGGYSKDTVLDPTVRYSYEYPLGLNVKPGSKLHDRIRTEVLARARESRSIMSRRFDAWKKIDRTLTAYIPLKDSETVVKQKDPNKPVSIVVPSSYATLETLLTYLTGTFLTPPIFKYEGVGPEDLYGSIMLEILIDYHIRKSKVGLNLHTMFRDGLAYGTGIATPYWTKRTGTRTGVGEQNVTGSMGGVIETRKTLTVEDVIYEGNALANVNPFLYLPDPNFPAHDIQKGEYVGWISRTNRNNLLKEEQISEDLFNCKYLKHTDGRSALYSETATYLGSERSGTGETSAASSITKPVDVVYMYITLIPSDWELGDSDYPEKWLFAVAGDEIVIKAMPLGLNHNLYPVVAACPNFDGYSATPVASLEVCYGLQEVMDWLFNSHITNVRKAINDMIIVDPMLINVEDLMNPEPGKIIRTRRSRWGEGIQNAITQLKISDVTQNNINDAVYVNDIIQRVSAITDSLQGIMRTGGERRSATESRETRGSALSRLEKMARLISMQAMQDLGEMFASHAQQLMSADVYVKVMGKWEETLRTEYHITDPRIRVSPLDLAVNYDVVAYDNTVGGGEYIDSWIQIFQIVSQNPAVSMQFDLVRIFLHMARLMGAKNLQDFINKAPMMAPQVMPDEQVMQQADAGNMIPMEAMYAQQGAY